MEAVFDHHEAHMAFAREGVCAEPPEDGCRCQAIEVNFAMPVTMSMDQQIRLHELLSEIVRNPWNQPKEGVHWLSSHGAKVNWSQADLAFMGKPANPDAPASGEPTFDDDVFSFESSARPFVAEEERERVLRDRALKAAPGPGPDIRFPGRVR